MINLIVHAFHMRWQYYKIHLQYTEFEYYLYYILFRQIFLFSSIINITTYMQFFSAYTVILDPHVVYYLLFSIHLLLLQPINQDYSRLSFEYIAYSANNTRKRCVFVIYIHKGKWNSLIFIILYITVDRSEERLPWCNLFTSR